jgi:hypothetical protein
MKIKGFYKEGDKNIIEFEDGRKIEYGKDYLTELDKLVIEINDDVTLMKSDIDNIKKKVGMK